MASKIAMIKEDYYPNSFEQAIDITDGDKTFYGGLGTEVVNKNYFRFRTSTWEYDNKKPEFHTGKTKWDSNFNGYNLRMEGRKDVNDIFNENNLMAEWTCGDGDSNFTYEIGLQAYTSTNSPNFPENNNQVTMVRHVKGVCFMWATGGTNASSYRLNPYPQKVGLVYSTKSYGSRDIYSSKLIIPCTVHKSGDELKDYNTSGWNPRYTTMTITYSYDDWKQISNQGLIHVGYVFQFRCPRRGSTFQNYTNYIGIWNLRPVVCSGNQWGRSDAAGSSQLINIKGGANITDYSFGKVAFSNPYA